MPDTHEIRVAVMLTDVLGVYAHHARCLEVGCGWKSRRFNHSDSAVKAARKHGKTHIKVEAGR